MFAVPVFPTFDEAFRALVADLLEAPESSPRGMRCRERLVVTFAVANPRARLVVSPAREPNYRFAAGEFLWYLRGADDLATMVYYNRRMADFSDDGISLRSAYGRIWRRDMQLYGHTQWQNVADTLVADPDSRRAVMTAFAPSDLAVATEVGTKDVSCTLSLQFLIRDRRLHLHVVMRSNDVIWGLTNDVFSFTLLQEAMLLDLRDRGMADLELGTYHHTDGSLHLYERHYEMAERVVVETRPVDGLEMPPIRSASDLRLLLADEASIRRHEWPVGEYGGGARWLLRRLVEHRAVRDSEVTK